MLQSDREPEQRAAVWLAHYSDFSLHHLHETLADSQTESGTAVFPGGRFFSLSESLKEPRLYLGSNADAGVKNLKPQGYVVCIPALFGDLERDLAALSEFNGITNQICQDLANSPGVAAKASRSVRWEKSGYFQTLGLSGFRQQLQRIFDNLP